MADFCGFVKGRANLMATATGGQAQCSMELRENVRKRSRNFMCRYVIKALLLS